MNTVIELVAIVDKLKAEHGAVIAELSTIDKSMNDLYHMIEYLPLNARDLSRVTKKMKEHLRRRRALKEQSNINQMILQGIVEKTKAVSDIEKRVTDREASYRAEAKVAFDKMFGK